MPSAPTTRFRWAGCSDCPSCQITTTGWTSPAQRQSPEFHRGPSQAGLAGAGQDITPSPHPADTFIGSTGLGQRSPHGRQRTWSNIPLWRYHRGARFLGVVMGDALSTGCAAGTRWPRSRRLPSPRITPRTHADCGRVSVRRHLKCQWPCVMGLSVLGPHAHRVIASARASQSARGRRPAN